MRVFELFEAPLADFNVFDTVRGKKTTIKKNDLVKFKHPQLREILHKRFEKFDFDVNVYVVPFQHNESREITDQTKLLGFRGYYFRIGDNELSIMYGNEVADRIKVSDTGITLIYGSVEEFIDITPWALVHDMAHVMTLWNRTNEHLLHGVDRILSDVYSPDGVRPEASAVYYYNSINYFLADIGTMKSSRTGTILERPEEFTVELLTQWIYNGQVTFGEPQKIGNKRIRDRTYQNLIAVIPEIHTIFQQILDNAKGKIFYTSM